MPAPARPPIAVQLINGNAVLTSPATFAGYGLEYNMDLNTTNWATYAGTATTNGGNLNVVVPTTAGNNFFRLRSP